MWIILSNNKVSECDTDIRTITIHPFHYHDQQQYQSIVIMLTVVFPSPTDVVDDGTQPPTSQVGLDDPY